MPLTQYSTQFGFDRDSLVARTTDIQGTGLKCWVKLSSFMINHSPAAELGVYDPTPSLLDEHTRLCLFMQVSIVLVVLSCSWSRFEVVVK